ncbi:MAG: hypothetical protein VXV97_11435, partial [Pseudomonadota bacterium]|nr:hypothetical protein [Pseudomonadota bacterium]
GVFAEQRKGGIGQGLADLGSGNEAHQIADDPSEPRAFGIDILTSPSDYSLSQSDCCTLLMKAVSIATLISALRGPVGTAGGLPNCLIT